MPPKPNFAAVPPQGTGPPTEGGGIYIPVQPHWCFCKKVENREIWFPFSLMDSMRLEEVYRSGEGFAIFILRDTVAVSNKNFASIK